MGGKIAKFNHDMVIKVKGKCLMSCALIMCYKNFRYLQIVSLLKDKFDFIEASTNIILIFFLINLIKLLDF